MQLLVGFLWVYCFQGGCCCGVLVCVLVGGLFQCGGGGLYLGVYSCGGCICVGMCGVYCDCVGLL